MSRRKQLKPKPMKDDSAVIADEKEDDDDDDVTEGPIKKKSKPSATALIKSEDPENTSEEGEENRFVTIEAENRFDCQLCSAWFDSISALQTHTIRDHVPVPIPTPALECQQCNSCFSSFSAFAVHMRSHLLDPPSQPTPVESRCPQCGKLFGDPQVRLAHMISHFEHRQSRRSCTDCGVIMTNMAALGLHYAERHLTVQYLCTICAHISENQKEFRDHSLIHSEETFLFECGMCRVPFESRELLGIHVQLVHDRESTTDMNLRLLNASVSPASHFLRKPTPDRELRPLHCSVCDERCVGEDALDEHRLFSHCKVTHSDVCAECQECITTPEDFEKHTRLHARDMYMHCAVCRQSLRSEAQLALHMNFHMIERTKEKEKQTDGDSQCNLCQKTLMSQDQLNLHLLEHDTTKACPYCTEKFKLANQLAAHVTAEHSEESHQYSCETCEKTFLFAIQLENHKVEHTGETRTIRKSATASPNANYSCTYCSKVFQTLSGLQGHSQIHRDGHTRRCPICGLSFNTSSRFENHLRKHSNISSCVCQICGEGFIRRSDLESHMMIHKGNLELGAQNIIF